WQCHNMQCEEAVQCDTGQQIVAADPFHQRLTDIRNGTEQGDDYLCPPIGHLPPGQQVAHEAFSHQCQIDKHTEDPHEFAGSTVGTVHHAAEHMEIDNSKERGSTGRVKIANQPAILDIAHDVQLDRGKGAFAGGVIHHGQPDTCQQLDYQYQHGQRAKEIPEVEVLRSIIFAHVIFEHLGRRESGINPAHQALKHAHQAASPSSPILISDSLIK